MYHHLLSDDCQVTVEVDDNFSPNSQVIFQPLVSSLSLVPLVFPSVKQVMHYDPPLLSVTPR